MKTIGIIAEFNPFHNGHKYLIDRAKKITKADNVIVICSGNYVQRGMPALFDKTERAKMAIHNGVDAVFELPCYYSCSTAELFARAAVKFLDLLNCVDYLCFGCETDNLKMLPQIASVLSDEPAEFIQYQSEYLKTGISFPKARAKALIRYFEQYNQFSGPQMNYILRQSNNILAVEYLKALKHFHSSIRPLAIRRAGASYDSLEIDTQYASATGIRNEILQGNPDKIRHCIPENCFSILRKKDFVLPEDYSDILGFQLLRENSFSAYLDVSNELSNRINRFKTDFIGLESFISTLQSKNYTYSGIARALNHIVLNIKKEDVDAFIANQYFTCGRLLGFNRNSKILSHIKESSKIDIISKLSAYYSSCSGLTKKMLDVSIHGDELYRMIYMNKYNKQIPGEFERQIYTI